MPIAYLCDTLLSAGSYTPILAILFPDKPEFSQWLLGFMWSMAALGISVTAIMAEGKVSYPSRGSIGLHKTYNHTQDTADSLSLSLHIYIYI